MSQELSWVTAGARPEVEATHPMHDAPGGRNVSYRLVCA